VKMAGNNGGKEGHVAAIWREVLTRLDTTSPTRGRNLAGDSTTFSKQTPTPNKRAHLFQSAGKIEHGEGEQ
jgi:hypothetical protein